MQSLNSLLIKSEKKLFLLPKIGHTKKTVLQIKNSLFVFQYQ